MSKEESIIEVGLKAGTSSNKEEEEENENAEEVDEEYNDLGADLVIVSSDRVKFYVQKFYLLAASSVFRSMIQDCTAMPAEVRLTDEAIEPAAVIRLFLDLACGKPFVDFDALPFGDVFMLLKLCDKYDCPTPLQTLKLLTSRPQLLVSVLASPFYRFFYACTLDDVDTASRLFPIAAARTWAGGEGPYQNVKGGSCMDPTSMSTEWLDRMPRKYFYALLRASRLRNTTPQGSWQDVANEFKVQVKLRETPPK